MAVVARHWRAGVAGASSTVIPLDRAYFSAAVAMDLDIYEKQCGCARRGVGCMICGNALGSLYTPCAAHGGQMGDPAMRYAFLPAAVSSPVPGGHLRPPPSHAPADEPWQTPPLAPLEFHPESTTPCSRTVANTPSPRATSTRSTRPPWPPRPRHGSGCLPPRTRFRFQLRFHLPPRWNVPSPDADDEDDE
ncbi:hypothetical protein B0H14DRAFT_3531218 [Mycena olivaceomarginata]|nr:hypothetical protein B0H14DRAFT_3531218 [Mycena olivaceomarginata]